MHQHWLAGGRFQVYVVTAAQLNSVLCCLAMLEAVYNKAIELRGYVAENRMTIELWGF